MDVAGCLACDLLAGRRLLPGGVIHVTELFVVEHCIGPLGVGTLIVKPRRHVTRVSELTGAEAAELGGHLQRAAEIVDCLVRPEQVYTCLWSHAGRAPQHVHWVVQPATTELIDQHGTYGPGLQTALFAAAEPPPPAQVEAFAAQARVLWQ